MSDPIYTDECLEAIDRWSGVPEAPNSWSRERPNGITLMKNKVAEKVIGQAHPITPGIWFGPFIVYGLYKGFARGEVLLTLGLFVIGWLIWSLLEYLLHRYIFHWVANSAWGKKQPLLYPWLSPRVPYRPNALGRSHFHELASRTRVRFALLRATRCRSLGTTLCR